MASSNKTPFMGLNQWVGTDVPKWVDHNNDNERIDTEFGTLEFAAADPNLVVNGSAELFTGYNVFAPTKLPDGWILYSGNIVSAYHNNISGLGARQKVVDITIEDPAIIRIPIIIERPMSETLVLSADITAPVGVTVTYGLNANSGLFSGSGDPFTTASGLGSSNRMHLSHTIYNVNVDSADIFWFEFRLSAAGQYSITGVRADIGVQRPAGPGVAAIAERKLTEYCFYRPSTAVSVRASIITPNTIEFLLPMVYPVRGARTVAGQLNNPAGIAVRTLQGTAQTGFSFSAVGSTAHGLKIVASKNGHGLNDASLIVDSGVTFTA